LTEVAFHFGALDRLTYTCRLLRKATATGVRLLLRADAGELAVLDTALWNVGASDFISHCDDAAPLAMRRRSAVLLVHTAAVLDPDFPILVNLAADVPDSFEQFQRVIEIVSDEAHDRNQARVRWKYYTGRGYTITRHDLKSREA
jgi:DNA polymerase-3 subunit chi